LKHTNRQALAEGITAPALLQMVYRGEVKLTTQQMLCDETFRKELKKYSS
jgi:hypothetical protein